MDANDKLNLQKMINANDVQDCTLDIRLKCHSVPIRKDVDRMIELKNTHHSLERIDPDEFERILISECIFLFTNYTDIFNKIRKDEIDTTILYNFLDILYKIEHSELDQHTGSYQVGLLLKNLYIDSALRKSKKLDNSETIMRESKNITWKQYKKSLI